MKVDVNKLYEKFKDCKVHEGEKSNTSYIQVPTKLFIERYFDESIIYNPCTKKIIEDNVDYIRLDNINRVRFIRNYVNSVKMFSIDAPLYLINDGLGTHYIDLESDLSYIVKYFEYLYDYCPSVSDCLSDFIERICDIFTKDIKKVEQKFYEDIQECIIEEE